MRIPPSLEHEWRRDPDWLAALPRLVSECAERWRLELEEPLDTPHSLVIPAGEVVLKLNAPSHFEADHEAEALERWHGRGAVRLVGRDDERRALLVERCLPGTQLWESTEDERAVVMELLPRLWNPPTEPHPFGLLATESARWAQEVPRRYELGGGPFEPTLLDYAVDVFRTVDPAATALVNQDLHGGNVLRAEREPWLVIDPKPLVGEREANAVGLLRNAAWNGGAGAVRRWLDGFEELGLDRERARAWGAAHALAWGWDEDGRWDEDSIGAARTIADA
jgi:streptomycin 6-kinase